MRIARSTLVGTAVAMALFGRNGAVRADTPEAADLQEVVVTGIRKSLEQSLDVKRNSDTVVDAISAEDVGKFPDKNVAEALQRAPGVVVNRTYGEGERVSVRGTPNNLTHTTLNGHALATADWFILDQQAATRSFNYLILPADLISQVKVFKTQQADFEEGGIGGSIDVITRTPLEMKSPTALLSLEAVHTELAGHTTPDASLLGSWKNDAGTFGAMVAGIYQRRAIRRDGIEILGYSPQTQVGGALVPDLIGAPLFLQDRIRKGGNFSLEWKPVEEATINLNGLYSRFNANNVNESYLGWGANALGNGGTISNATIVNGFATAGTIDSRGNGSGTGNGAVNDDIIRQSHSQARDLDLDATFKPLEDWLLHAKVGYTDAVGSTDNQIFYESTAPAAFTYNLAGVPRVNFLNVNPNDPLATNPSFFSFHNIDNTDYERYAYLDVTKQLNLGVLKSIKFGVKGTRHARELHFNATGYSDFSKPFIFGTGCNGGPCTNAFFAGTSTLPSDFLSAIGNAGSIGSFWQIDQNKARQLFTNAFDTISKLGRIPYAQQEFSVQETDTAGYMMGNLEGDRWSGNAGVRFVKTKQTSLGTFPNALGSLSNVFGSYDPVKVDRTYNDILPSVNFKYDLQENLLVRVAASRAMTRPDYLDIAPITNLNNGAFTGTQGNPNLDPYRANQGDIGLEWYPDKDTVYAVDFFYKKILSFVTDRPVVEDVTAQLPLGSVRATCTTVDLAKNLYNCPFTVNVRSNGGGGSVKGFELDVQRPIWNGFGVAASYTQSQASADNGDPLPDNSKHIYNVSGYFENHMFSARLSFTERSNFLVQFDRSTELRQTALKSLDASLVYNVTDNIALTADGVNLTDEKISQYANVMSAPRAIYEIGRIYFAGVRLKF